MPHTKTAILSVYDKTGLLDLAKGLAENNVRILASGGTAKICLLYTSGELRPETKLNQAKQAFIILRAFLT